MVGSLPGGGSRTGERGAPLSKERRQEGWRCWGKKFLLGARRQLLRERS